MVGDSLAMNGMVTDLMYTENEPTIGFTQIGEFKSVCTVVSVQKSELLCTYVISINTYNDGVGVFVTTGRTVGLENYSIVAAAEFDFEQYTGGVLTTVAHSDPQMAVLFAYLTLT
jgi:hypothetical protein